MQKKKQLILINYNRKERGDLIFHFVINEYQVSTNITLFPWSQALFIYLPQAPLFSPSPTYTLLTLFSLFSLFPYSHKSALTQQSEEKDIEENYLRCCWERDLVLLWREPQACLKLPSIWTPHPLMVPTNRDQVPVSAAARWFRPGWRQHPKFIEEVPRISSTLLTSSVLAPFAKPVSYLVTTSTCIGTIKRNSILLHLLTVAVNSLLPHTLLDYQLN